MGDSHCRMRIKQELKAASMATGPQTVRPVELCARRLLRLHQPATCKLQLRQLLLPRSRLYHPQVGSLCLAMAP